MTDHTYTEEVEPETVVILSAQQIELATLKAEKERVNASVQKCFDLSQEIKKDSSKILQFKARCANLREFYAEFKTILRRDHALSLAINPNTNADDYAESMEYFEALYYPTLEAFESISANNAEHSGRTFNTSSFSAHNQSSVRLPRIELKTFDGTLSDWPEFLANFEALIHKNESLTDTAKFHYLRSSLTGPALALVKELPLTETNYPIAWASLTKRYSNNRVLGAELLNKLMNFSQIKRESETELSKFLSTFGECVSALKALPQIDLADFIILHMAVKCLPMGLHKAFERSISETEIPKVADLLKFVQHQIQILGFVRPSESSSSKETQDAKQQKTFVKRAFVASNSSEKPFEKRAQYTNPATSQNNSGKNCACCQRTHFLYACPKFNAWPVSDRRTFVQKERLCFNCMRSGHSAMKCLNVKRCVHCDATHHSLLHETASPTLISPDHASLPPSNLSSEGLERDASDDGSGQALSAVNYNSHSTALLGSAVFQVRGAGGKFFNVRGLIDSCASTSFITSKCAERIGLEFHKSNSTVSGIGNQPLTIIKGRATCLLRPRHAPTPVLNTETLIIPSITCNSPSVSLSPEIKAHYRHLFLADSNFDNSNPVEFLIGADAFPFIYTGKVQADTPGIPPALSSIFGWVITGKLSAHNLKRSQSKPQANVLLSTDKILTKFWEIEEIPMEKPPHPDDVICEEMFSQRHYRLEDGRYVTPLMLKENAPALGESKNMALKRLLGTERKLARDPTLKKGYSDFLEEYEDLGHMTPFDDPKSPGKYIIPHSCVVRAESLSTKYRVVFDASQKTSNGLSLNDIVYAGPKLQTHIFDVIFKFRLHEVVFTCDICKMYRQILVRPDERKYQHILWRKNDELQEFELNTVTYGVTSAPFVSLRTLKQLAIDEGPKYPLAAEVICSETYVDDIASGDEDILSARAKQRETRALLLKGGFEAKKWASNRPEILDDIPDEHRVTSFQLHDENKSSKILGIGWDARSDIFSFKSTISPHSCTKRNILSNIARIYDPLGWVSPIVFYAKALMQTLWLQGLDWDTKVPPHIEREWTTFCTKLECINTIQVPRATRLPAADRYSLIGFCDASERGYAATAYLRSEKGSDVRVRLLAAKSKVAPTKTISIPRLELCGAQLLSNLIQSCKNLLSSHLTLNDTYTYTDSEVVLAWLRTTPCYLKTFVANRVTLILEKTEPSAWRHVISSENPADVASRGCLPDQLKAHPLWWNGPSWLTLPLADWPVSVHNTEPQNEEFRGETKSLLTDNSQSISSVHTIEQLIEKYSSLTKLQRVTAWILRFCHNLQHDSSKNQTSFLSVEEIEKSLMFLIKIVQIKHFSAEISQLQKGTTFLKRFSDLQPFLDTDGVLRVGGRLRNAQLPYNSTHPILLPKNDTFVTLLINAYHIRYLHVGPRTLHSLLARKFWILSARTAIRSQLSKCVTCFKVKPKGTNPLMGDLPAARVTPSKVFSNVGVDFGGPFIIREHKRRNPKLAKAYLSLFVCLATKAVHLEVVSELSSAAFLAALDRFISRRGLCKTLHSDNGTNFTGAKRQISELYQLLLNDKKEMTDELTSRKIDWKFIPPAAPHFGGIWEAGVKSAKYHLKRVIGEQTLTFEELTTTFCRIEAIMNSRPLGALPSDASEIDVLTPGHFLVGGPLVARPEIDFQDTKINRLDRWQLIQQITQRFWHQWSRDYLHTLQQRSKWTTAETDTIDVNDIVIVAEDNAPPTCWRLGRITKVHPGVDDVVRVVTVRTSTAEVKRPVVKVYKLPITK